MICKDFNFFPTTGRLAGIDWGEKRVGVAVSDPGRGFVFARPRITAAAGAAKRIADFAKSENIAGIVVGLPLRLDGTESETTARVRAFAEELAKETDIPVILFDEGLTSFEAAERGAENLDSEAARILLENAVGFMARNSAGKANPKTVNKLLAKKLKGEK
ncbi:MAG: Holliday junction resolvase RuvX [Rickettsiales bacterium]|jgi:putative Holliday junction resolvase|nr:Holliday junction resolvase RuvX [Rickettsiales bacterium]